MKKFTLNAETRGDLGKGASRRLRHADKFPAVIYGGEAEPQSLTMDHPEILKVIDDESFYTSILDINIDGKASKAVVKDIQRHPYKPKVTHMDFQRVSENQTIHMLVPVHLTGAENAPGVKLGGQLTHLMNAIDVACKAKDIPEYIELDVSAMNIGDTLHISDLPLPEGVVSVELSHGEDHDQPVVAIQKSRGMKSDDEEASEEAEGESE
jgi:large subunit ribosomal protein L25